MLLLLLFSVASASAANNSVTFTIETTWDGKPISWNPATVTLSTTEPEGDLRVEVSAPFFNSPKLREDLWLGNGCPERPHRYLYNYEVVEAFFLNDDEHYLELELSPQGAYFFLMLDGRRNPVLAPLPLLPKGIESLNSPCLQADCADPWTAAVVVPRQYLPPKITKFNAYAIHGEPRNSEAPDEIIYQSLFPADPEVVPQPDFHYLDGFGSIDLSEIGFVEDEQPSQLWQGATSDGVIVLRYQMSLTNDCLSVPETYSSHVETTKNPSERSTTFVFKAQDDDVSFQPSIPEELKSPGLNPALTEDFESFWLAYTNTTGHQLRVGANPYGAYRVMLLNGDEVLADDLEAGVRCWIGDHYVRRWSCTVKLPFEVFPNSDDLYFQLFHAHKPAFIASVCPGILDGQESANGLDWRGCETDFRTVTD